VQRSQVELSPLKARLDKTNELTRHKIQQPRH
jgi:hypothetical protein